MKRLALILLVFFLTLGVNAQDSGLSFLRLGPDARSLALGDAGVASSEGAYATYWNPAGLARPGNREVAFSHHIWIADVRTLALQGAFSLGPKTGIGLFVVATGSGDLEARTAPGESDGFFDAQFVSSGLSLGHSFGPIRVGATVKYLSERIFTNSANGYAFDFGLQTSFLEESLLFGATYSNLGKMEELNVVATKLPELFRTGVEIFPFRILMESDGSPLLNTSLMVEYSQNFATEQAQIHVGLSAEVLETVSARLGYLSKDALRSFSAGLGMEISTLVVDYAIIPFEDGFGGPAHIMTVGYSF
ncbi:MAG: PorV/PorQ family protein [Bacteroidetes bacterium]|nr:PorV/PorQ family protein [Bacteroidota bacterium]